MVAVTLEAMLTINPDVLEGLTGQIPNVYRELDGTIVEHFSDEVLEIQSQNIINELMAECGCLRLSITNPEILKAQVSNWAKIMSFNWKLAARALSIEYHPLNNFDRNEEYTDSEKMNDSGTNTTAGNSSNTTVESGDNARKVAAFDSSTMQPSETSNQNGNSTVTSNFENGDTYEGERNRENKHNARMWGNIGVTTSQQMLLSEFNEACSYRLDQRIINDFKYRFCILVY